MNIPLIAIVVYLELGIILCLVRMFYTIHKTPLGPLRGKVSIEYCKKQTYSPIYIRLPLYVFAIISFTVGILAWPYYAFHNTILETVALATDKASDEDLPEDFRKIVSSLIGGDQNDKDWRSDNPGN